MDWKTEDLVSVCADSGRSGVFGCFVGECVNSTCICSSPWFRHDNMLLLVENCAQPSFMYHVILGVQLLLFLLATRSYQQCCKRQFSSLQTLYKRLIHRAYIGSCISLLISVSLFRSNGHANPIAYILFVINIISTMYVGYEMILNLIVIPALEIEHVLPRQRKEVTASYTRKFFIGMAIIVFHGIMQAASYVCLFYGLIDAAGHNRNWVIVVLICDVGVVVIGFLERIQIHHMIAVVAPHREQDYDNRLLNEAIEKLVLKLTCFHRNTTRILLNVLASHAFALFCFFYFGSIPFLFLTAISSIVVLPVINLNYLTMISKKSLKETISANSSKVGPSMLYSSVVPSQKADSTE